MGLREFKADLHEAKSALFQGISNVRKGVSENDFSFFYSHQDLPYDIEVQGLVTDVDSYPARPEYILFVSSDGVDDDISNFLSGLPPRVRHKPISQVIGGVSEKLTAKLSGEETSSEEDFSPDGDEYALSDWEDDLEEVRLASASAPQAQSSLNYRLETLEKQRRDLVAATKAGFSVGVSGAKHNQLGEVISLSVLVGRLGVSDEVLEAWNLQSSNHLILLIRFIDSYPCHLGSHLPGTLGEYRLGKCTKPKPSAASMQQAFRQTLASGNQHEDQDPCGFTPLYLFNFISRLLEKDFPMLLGLRRKYGFSWRTAQVNFYNHVPLPSEQQTGDSGESDHIDLTMPWIMRQDNGLAPMEDLSVPLVAMQFALQRLVLCGRSCINCQREMADTFEPIRPYVCSRPLCQDQYFSLCLSPGIEHEIINSPYVVDLLISFFHEAVQTRKLREFPKGLRIKAPGSDFAPPVNVQVSFEQGKARLEVPEPSLSGWAQHLQKDERVFFIPGCDDPGEPHGQVVWKDDCERRLCRIVSVDEQSFNFETLWTGSPVYRSKKTTDNEWNEALAIRFNHDLDDLATVDRDKVLLMMTCSIPSVLEMRRYLMKYPGRPLSQATELLDQSTYRLLHWIVTSSKSFIVQDEAVRAPAHDLWEPGSPLPSIKNRVLGIGSKWLQFRFVQGSPDKERRFVEELNRFRKRGRFRNRPSTLFAWHGSSLGNWHGIVTTGLNYDKTQHGRSFGDGVYFSSMFATSNGYSSPSATASHTWPNSELKISAAISMCEIINVPRDFVSHTPHYVVKDLDWIQCRYLFVRIDPTQAALEEPELGPSTPTSKDYLSKNEYPLYGEGGGHVLIPDSAVPASRRRKDDTARNATAKRGRSETADEIAYSDAEGTDLDGVLGENALGNPKRRRIEDLQTDFRPGTLDLDTLPRLPEPGWATPMAIRSLALQSKQMQKAQNESGLAALGWYIDFERLNNLFQWIVELHSFDKDTPLAQDMKKKGCTSIVLEMRFGADFPRSPPFVRVIRPRFLPFQDGGGGHVTIGGAICSEILTSNGWTPVLSLETVLMQIRVGLCEGERPARLDLRSNRFTGEDYGILDAIEAYRRAAQTHGWTIPQDVLDMLSRWNMQ